MSIHCTSASLAAIKPAEMGEFATKIDLKKFYRLNT